MTSTVPSETPDGQEELLAQLRDLVPSAFLDGELDRDALIAALGLDDDSKPAFSFTWPGIDRARHDARVPTTATLVPDESASLHWSNARDVLIEGDNLQVLKLLKNGYSRAVKLIYIDPPYNTGDTFTYNDDFAVPERQYLEETGQVDEQGNATTSRIEAGGRKHAPWLTMMFPRLALARHLLRRDGVILVSIDDNEVHHLRLLLDAVFGAENFVDMIDLARRRARAMPEVDWRSVRTTSWSTRATAPISKRTTFVGASAKTGLEPIYAKVAELREQLGDGL